MQFIFDSKTAKKMARALEKFLKGEGLGLAHGQALNALAAMQGHSDWNSLAASLAPAAPEVPAPSWQLTTPITLYVRVDCSGEYTAPTWAKIEVTQEKLDLLRALAEVVREHNLFDVKKHSHVAEWSTDAPEELRIDYEYLEVSHDSFWYTGEPKHGGFDFETRPIEVQELLQAVQGAEHAKHGFCERHDALVLWGDEGDREILIEQLLEAEVALPGFEPPAE